MVKCNPQLTTASIVKTFFYGASLLFITVTYLSAAPVTIVNPGFEDNFTDSTKSTPIVFGPSAGTVGFGTTGYFNNVLPPPPHPTVFIPGWVGTNPGYSYVGIQNAVAHYSTQSGLTVAFMQVGEENLSQTLNATLEASSVYTLSFQVGCPSDKSQFEAPSAVHLFAGKVDLTPSSKSTPTPAAGSFVIWTFSYNTADVSNSSGVGQTIKISIDANVPKSHQVNLDNFSLDVVPASDASAAH